MFEFKITGRDKKTAARTGVFATPHGSFRTPVFMPVGTYGAVKTVTPAELRECGAEIILGNTFHLNLRPGPVVVKKLGGLAAFNGWQGPTLTDSGGFQVFSLAAHRKVFDDRVEFRAPLDGSLHVFTPASTLKIQKDLGADIAMQLDECVPGDASHSIAERAVERSARWAEISVKRWWRYRDQQALFPIVQGASHADLRRLSAEFCADLPTPGVAIGGLAVGETKAQFISALETVTPLLPVDKPRYLMGVGDPSDIVQAVARGIDMFDCVAPTRLARHGGFFTGLGADISQLGAKQNLRQAKFARDTKPLVADCRCPACQGYSRAYLRHLLVIGEPLVARLLTLHNLTYMFDLLDTIRQSIEKNSFSRLFGQASKAK